MGSELSKGGDFADVATKLRERIQAAFVDLIPQERWDEMLKREVDRFMTPTETRDRHSGNVTVVASQFTQICHGILTELVRDEAKKRFEAMNKAELTVAIANWIDENHERVLKQFIQDLFSNGVAAMTQTLSWDVAHKIQTFIQNHPTR